MSARPPASALQASPSGTIGGTAPTAPAAKPNPFAATMSARPPASAIAAAGAAGTATAVVGAAPAVAPVLPAAVPTPKPAAAPAPAKEPPTIINRTIIRETTVVVQAPPPTPVVVGSPYGGVGYAAPVAIFEPPSLADIAVGVGMGMAVKAIADVVMPSPDKVLNGQMRQDEREMDKQQDQIRQLQSQLADMKK
mmetsp:Transcript_77943/g.198054  ORF Transcript_77943/g.198054 Transcript_77943/m.198054 type:complete len:194 (+) Transcript_77943:3-584(+)